MKKVIFGPYEINGYRIDSVTNKEANKFLAIGTKIVQTEDRRNVQVKYILKFSTDPTEAAVLSQINFDKIVRPVEYFRYSNYFVFVSPCQSSDLSKFLDQNRSISLRIGLQLMYDCSESVRVLHYNNIAHGKVRLENFLLDISNQSKPIQKENNQTIQNSSKICIRKAILCNLDSAKILPQNKENSFNNSNEFSSLSELISYDIYSLGIVLNCIWARTQKTYAKKAVDTTKIDNLLLSMISQNHTQRPNADLVLHDLYYFMKDISQK